MKDIVILGLMMFVISKSSLFSQNISLHVDSLVISSLPWQLSPGIFCRTEEGIRGNRKIVVKDSLSISEFINCSENGFNKNNDQIFFIDPRVVVDVYCGNTFFSVSVDEDRLCWFSNKNQVTVNVCLFKWITKYAPLNSDK